MNSIAIQDYYPFGMLMPDRFHSTSDYRFGFNGKEMDDEVKGSSGTSYDYGERFLDVRIARWLSLDKMKNSYPSISPFVFGANNPLIVVDVAGKLLTDKDGNIIYTPNGDPTYGLIVQDDGTEIIVVSQKVFLWSNDGKTKVDATIVQQFSRNEDRGSGWVTTTMIEVKSLTKDGQQLDVTFDCHGKTFTDGKFFINSYEQDAAGHITTPTTANLLKGDGYSKPFTDINGVTKGDIAVFKDAAGNVIHSATFNEDGKTLNSKNGNEVGNTPAMTLDELKVKYGTSVEFYKKVPDKILSNVTTVPQTGYTKLSESQVKDAVAGKPVQGQAYKKEPLQVETKQQPTQVHK